ncbi:uncharacterized protein LOC123865629 isoform X2 [Maniola jurtina]|uniref:uncharacterized protein LOC123865629 isoform X2 n=1 Tax=Maniola jurtina TaxID=191418 RepID=UPI001E6868A0|nr:uncharacterized protein LOC123865629 isoform X2 [Maniola jurtina]
MHPFKCSIFISIVFNYYLELTQSLNEMPPIDDEIVKSEAIIQTSGRRIFKGDRTKIKYFPFMASIQIFNNFHCAGSIIKSDLIITASSCLQLAWNNRLFRENPAFLSARVGSSFYSGGGEVIPVLEIYFHPSYNPKTLRNNICLLRLVRHLNFRRKSRRIKKIDFDRQPSGIPVTTPGITILGWGAKTHSPIIGNPWKNILSYTVLHVYPLQDCQDVYSREYVTRKNFCAGFFSRGGGACNRDVGGPGIVDSKLMGIISFGSPVCGTPDAPTVFTKLGYYSDWIEEIMEMDIPVSKKRTTLKPLHDPFTALPLYSTKKPTKFKIQPHTGGTMTPIPISVIDNQLRIFDNNVFKDFLATMFHSEEVAEDQDVEDVEGSIELETTVKYGTKYYEDVTEKAKRITEYEDVSTDEIGASHKNTAVTLINAENQQSVYDSDEDIEKLIENVSMEKNVKGDVMVTPIVDKETKDSDIKSKGSHKSKNENLLTLLYLSDDEKKDNVKMIPVDDNNIVSDEWDDFSGMSIPVNFDDLTRAKHKVVSELPESDLFR